MNIKNDIRANSNESFVVNNLSFDSPSHTDYFWKNLIIEKRMSMNLVDKLYKGSVLHAFWSIWSSPIV